MDIFITLFFSLFLSTLGATDVSVPNTSTNTPIVHEFNRDRVAITSRQEREIPIYDIPLSKELQEYTYQQAQLNELPLTLVYAVMKVESDFDPMANSGSSKGLMQLNTNTYPWLAEEVGIDNPNPFDEKQNIQMGVWYLKWLSDYWRNQGYSEELIFNLSLLSYNRGVYGAKTYIQNHGYDHVYIDKVLEYKLHLEMSEDNG